MQIRARLLRDLNVTRMMRMICGDDHQDDDDGDSGLPRMWSKTEQNKTAKVKFKPTEAKRNLSDSSAWEFRHGWIQGHKCYLSTLT